MFSRHDRFALPLLVALANTLLSPRPAEASPASFTFSAPNPGWTAVTLGGAVLNDPEGDSPGGRDIVGDAANPMLYVASDATHIYFRLRVDSDPLQQATNFGPFGWGCFISTDGVSTSYEYSSVIDGVNNPDQVRFFKNTVTTTANDPNDSPEVTASTVFSPLTAPIGHARVVAASSTFGATPDYFIDWAVELSAAQTAGYVAGAPARFYCGSSNNGTNIDADCSGGSAGGCPLSAQFSDPVSCGVLGCGVCGDGIVSGPEACDDGNAVNGDGCTSTCQAEIGQPCDAGADCTTGACSGVACVCDDDSDCPSGQSCNTAVSPAACVAPACGNGLISSGEACDDGNTNAGDGCGSTCLRELGQSCSASGQCESAFCDASGNLCACNDDNDCSGSDICDTAAAPNACVAAGCGNGILEAGEGCDDGDLSDGDGCDGTCLIELGAGCGASDDCASGFCDPAGAICACDQSTDCAAGQQCNTAATPNVCVTPGCGNGLVEGGEACDDGNTNAGDGCGSSCLRELGGSCGANGSCESGYCAGSVCGCNGDNDCPGSLLCRLPTATCVAAGCGNGVLESSEACDDGGVLSGDGCTAACLRELGQGCGTNAQCASGYCDADGSICSCNDDADCPGSTICDAAAAPNACIAAGCGNGVVELGEGCDDHNLDNDDGCSASCMRELGIACGASAQCASGFCDPAGSSCACDQSSDCASGQLCNIAASPNTCYLPGCGNGIVDSGEACDDSNTSAGDGCSAACLRELGQGCTTGAECASGHCDASGNVCSCNGDDDCPGSLLCDIAAAPNACVAPGCGNGISEVGEACDDGGLSDGDGCSADCLREIGISCGGSGECESGFCDPAGSVCACDQSGDCPSGQLCNTAASPNVCTLPGCGNGLVDGSEACDDGNTSAGDGCNATCLRELGEACGTSGQCASGFCDPSGGVCSCNDDNDCAGSTLCDSAASPNACVPAGCSNGILEVDEGCDDGNLAAGDGCNAGCLREIGVSCDTSEQCASGFCDSAASVCACDQSSDCPAGQLCNAAATPNACTPPGCGNGLVDGSEACDDANATAGDGCSAVCLIELGYDCSTSAGCESGFCKPGALVCACDQDGDCGSGFVCDVQASCVAAGCGNGVLEASEACDDGGAAPGDGCDASCLIELGFACDDHAACASGFCDAGSCACDESSDCPSGTVCYLSPTPNACLVAGCGNGQADLAEACDDGNLTDGDGCSAGCLRELGQGCADDIDCESGFCDATSDTCACNETADCEAGAECDVFSAPNACVPAACGNHVKSPDEACDDGNDDDGDGCNAACRLEIGEPCVAHDDCASGYCDPSNPSCACDQTEDCPSGDECVVTLSPNQCVPFGCGNGVQSGAEACDDGNLVVGDGCNAQCLLEIGEACGASESCASGWCDPAGSVCACDHDNDCGGSLLCDTAQAPSACVTAICGDGLLTVPEGCDDQNSADADGCSASCTIESGWLCGGEPSVCERVLCEADSDCVYCNEAVQRCMSGCTDDADCKVGEQCHTETGICFPRCETDADCSTGVCDEGSGRCIECADASDCPAGVCGGGVCGVGCSDDNDCGQARCDETKGVCVACEVDADCVAEMTCKLGACVAPCNEEADCGGDACDETLGLCIECDTENPCSVGVCHSAVGQCVGCLVDADCASGVCDGAAHECVGCKSDDDCASGVCDEAQQACVECVTHADCVVGVCDEGQQACVECTSDGDCASGVCLTSSSTCAPVEPTGCESDSDCPGAARCENESETCVECVERNDCDTLVCDADTHECTSCVADTDCAVGYECDAEVGACVLSGDAPPLPGPAPEEEQSFRLGGGMLGCSASSDARGRTGLGIVALLACVAFRRRSRRAA